MHSFRQSRGRILFDFFCTLVIVASCAGAWMQTGASALLGAAAAAGLYGLVRLFDLGRPKTAEAIKPQRIDFATDPRGDVMAELDADEPRLVAQQQLATDGIEKAKLVESAAPQTKPDSKAKAPRKGGGRKVSAAKSAKIIELAPPEDAEVTELSSPEEAEVSDFVVPDDMTHAHIEPLFEPDPFVRMPRRAFGRRGRI